MSLPPPPGFPAVPAGQSAAAIPSTPPVEQSIPKQRRIDGQLTPEIRDNAENSAKELCRQEELQQRQRAYVQQRTENVAAMIYAFAVQEIPHTDYVGLLGCGNAAIRKAVAFAQNVFNYNISLGPSNGPNGEPMPLSGEVVPQETAKAQADLGYSIPPQSQPQAWPRPEPQLTWSDTVSR